MHSISQLHPADNPFHQKDNPPPIPWRGAVRGSGGGHPTLEARPRPGASWRPARAPSAPRRPLQQVAQVAGLRCRLPAPYSVPLRSKAKGHTIRGQTPHGGDRCRRPGNYAESALIVFVRYNSARVRPSARAAERLACSCARINSRSRASCSAFALTGSYSAKICAARSSCCWVGCCSQSTRGEPSVFQPIPLIGKPSSVIFWCRYCAVTSKSSP
jgi:hypothetical protein